jgi:glucose/arabinose dehydrogenase
VKVACSAFGTEGSTGRESSITVVRKLRDSQLLVKVLVVLAAVAAALTSLAALPPLGANAATLPSAFQEKVVYSGLSNPTTVQFAKDGRVFVAEKSGLIKVFDNLSDRVPTTVADPRTNVYNF